MFNISITDRVYDEGRFTGEAVVDFDEPFNKYLKYPYFFRVRFIFDADIDFHKGRNNIIGGEFTEFVMKSKPNSPYKTDNVDIDQLQQAIIAELVAWYEEIKTK